MTNGGLSQEDIDRLLSGAGTEADRPAETEAQQAEPDAASVSSPDASDPQDGGPPPKNEALLGDIPAEPQAPEPAPSPLGLGLGLGPSADADPAVGSAQHSSAFAPPQSPTVRQVQFTQLPEPSRRSTSSPIDLILDVNLKVTVELGRTSLPIAEILQLGPGAVIELDKLAGEPVDVLVNGKLVAKAEVVVIDENFGVRITEIISPEDRIRQFT